MEPDGPVIVFAHDWVLQWLPLRMALNTGIVRPDRIQPRRVDDVYTRWVRNVFTSRAVASLTTHVPFGDGFRFDVMVDRVTAIAERTCWALEVVQVDTAEPTNRFHFSRSMDARSAVQCPVGQVGQSSCHDLLEIALLPPAPVHEGNIFFCEGNKRIVL